MVKAGAFDNLNKNRQSLFNSIPNFIQKTKKIFDNKTANQIDLFGENENQENEILSNTEDWKIEENFPLFNLSLTILDMASDPTALIPPNA